jgi:hypothetical protein
MRVSATVPIAFHARLELWDAIDASVKIHLDGVVEPA